MKMEKNLADFVHLEKMKAGSSIYHYTNSVGIMGIMEHRAFWASKSDFLNDPQEFRYIMRVVEDVCRVEIPKKKWREKFLKQYRKRNLKTSARHGVYYAHKEYYVLSFSVYRDSITLWSEFSNETGYNMEFDYEKLLESLEGRTKLIWHGRVIYGRKEQEKLLRELMLEAIPACLGSSFEEIMDSEQFDKYMELFQRAQNIYAMFFKKEGFRDENEYRFILKRNAGETVYFRERDGFLLPYMEVPILDGQGNIPVNSLMVAPMNHSDLAQKGMEYYMHSKGYQVDVEVSQLQLRY